MFRTAAVTVSWQGASVKAVRDIAIEAENLGFDYFWVPEAWGLEALSTIGHILSVTEKIKIGSGILNVYSRSAALIGMACATLDQIAQGRFILGLGSSGRLLIEDWHGVRFQKPLERTKEYVEVVKSVSSGKNVEYDGNILKLSRFRIFTKPIQSRQEIYLGAIGEQNLRLASRISDGAILASFPISKLDYALSIMNEGGADKKIFSYHPFRVVNTDEERIKARAEAASNIAFYIASMGKYYSQNLSKLGYSESVLKIIETHAKLGGRETSKAVDERLLDDLTLIGTSSEISDKVRKMPAAVVPVFALKGSTENEVQEGIDSLRKISEVL
jgi:alkanesulfonate monooxygenase SsuD/methylene tetrahydromethanopterin reductase-like flavin-dependent oxidoreductase (luciferase family)